MGASLFIEILRIDHPSWVWSNRRHKRVLGAIALVVFGTTFPVLLIYRASLLGHVP
jgi:hypothetical protein